MATHAIGKLKFNLSKQGLAYRWGDGDVHRLFQGKDKQSGEDDFIMEEDAPEADGGYQDDYDAREGDPDGMGYEDDPVDADEGYQDERDGGYEDDRDDGYDDDGYDDRDDGYDEDGYDDDRYDDRDDGYDDDRYDDDRDDGYDDGRYDDDRDGGYDDDGYDDDRDGGYDDGYDGDRYDDDGYDGRDDRYDEDYDDRYEDQDAGEDAYYSEQSALTRYVDENDWVTYLLLFLFPPLGIYLLWRRQRFDKPIRWAITAASAIWFVVALILLLRGVLGGSGDRNVQPNITIPPATVEVTSEPTDAPAAADAESVTTIDLGGGDAQDATGDEAGTDAGETEPSPSPTALSSAGVVSADTAAFVWSPATGLYYHSTDTCPRIDAGVKSTRVTREIAENSRHQSPCPDCIGGGAMTMYYGTLGGKYYHSDPKCSKMRNPLEYTKTAAENEGKQPCPVCILKTKTSLEESEDVVAVLINDKTVDKSGIQVYATKNGTYFHVKSDCSGMENATKAPLRNALLAGKKACPTCCATAGTLVYCTSGGKSYHIDKNCQGMNGAKQVTLAEAMVLGKSKCDVCIKGSVAGITGTDTGTKTVNLGNATGDDVKVYATKNGTYYHTNSTCSGMKDAQMYTLKSMLLAGKKACPVCAQSATTKVYASKGGKYYHSYATCSGMTNANAGTLAEALAAGFKRCPNCWGNTAANTNANTNAAAAANTQTANADTANQKAQAAAAVATVSSTRAQAAPSKATASNTYVYATRTSRYYHLNSTCGGMTNASRVSLKTAVKAGKKACPICASAANKTVYSTSTGKHYHVASICVETGMKNGTKRTLAEALLMNQTACQHCLSSRKAAAEAVAVADAAKSGSVEKVAVALAAQRGTSTYRSGKSGVRVYASVSGKYYHTRSSCPNLSGTPNRVTLETALNYGKKACPKCAASATRKVYATKGGKYYHYSKSDAGSGAKEGTLASALAYGFDPCPNCVQGVSSGKAVPVTTAFKSGTSGIKVYATTGSKYYHANASCSGLTGASRVSLETALNYGKKACPVCLSAANQKVYSSSGDSHYHYSKAHAGSGATAGTLATARAIGLTACPGCTTLSAGAASFDNGGAEKAPVSIEMYAAPADTGVYVDLASANSYYHKSAKCGKANFSGGEKVSLQYALDWDYKACPYCNPPTSAIPISTET